MNIFAKTHDVSIFIKFPFYWAPLSAWCTNYFSVHIFGLALVERLQSIGSEDHL